MTFFPSGMRPGETSGAFLAGDDMDDEQIIFQRDSDGVVHYYPENDPIRSRATRIRQLRRMGRTRRRVFRQIIALRDEIGPVPFKVNELLREVRNGT